MQDLQPIQRFLSKSTMPSSRKNKASTGQISTQGASVQWLQRITEKSRRVCGNSPFSTCFTQVLLTPTGTKCSDLQAVVQAWQPMHFLLSMINPYFIPLFLAKDCSAIHLSKI